MSLPNRIAYIDAIKNVSVCLRDPMLKGCSVIKGADGEPVFSFGSFAGVFLINCREKRYALRCWIANIDDSAHRYRAVKHYLGQFDLPYFVDFEYVEDAIVAGNEAHPILRMDWIEAKSLRDFIEENLNNSELLLRAADNFLAMERDLHHHRIAHGDLQSENVRVRANGAGPQFRLIDYDTLFVPGLLDAKVNTTGLPGFQHPKRTQIATAKDDYFAELVIYLAFCALAQKPKLWTEERMTDREGELIFQPEDFAQDAPRPSDRFQKLLQLEPPVNKLALLLWNYTRCSDIQCLLPLEEAVNICSTFEIVRSNKSFQELIAAKMSSPTQEEWLTDWSTMSTRVSNPRQTKESPDNSFENVWNGLIIGSQGSQGSQRPKRSQGAQGAQVNNQPISSFEMLWERRAQDGNSICEGQLESPPQSLSLELRPREVLDPEPPPAETFWVRRGKVILAIFVLIVLLIILLSS